MLFISHLNHWSIRSFKIYLTLHYSLWIRKRVLMHLGSFLCQFCISMIFQLPNNQVKGFIEKILLHACIGLYILISISTVGSIDTPSTDTKKNISKSYIRRYVHKGPRYWNDWEVLCGTRKLCRYVCHVVHSYVYYVVHSYMYYVLQICVSRSAQLCVLRSAKFVLHSVCICGHVKARLAIVAKWCCICNPCSIVPLGVASLCAETWAGLLEYL